MRNPSTAALLAAWEQGLRASPGERGLLLLRLAEPETALPELAAWTVGRRDAALLDLFARLFGDAIEAQAECPGCDAALELDVSAATLRSAATVTPTDSFVLEHVGRFFSYRLPNTGDLAALPEAGADRGRWLLRRCLLDVDEAGVSLGEDALRALETAIAATTAAVDPLAEIELTLDCPQCGHAWGSPFDIVAFAWNELENWARDILADIHVLACRYGWSEADILALGAHRRRRYIEMIGA